MTEADVAIVGLTTALTAVSAVAVACGIAWRRAAKRVQRLEDRLLWDAKPEPNTSARDRVTTQLDNLVGQIDRLSEGQDFLARVLADRGAIQSAPALPEPHLPTPH